jgi:hypothetical protein
MTVADPDAVAVNRAEAIVLTDDGQILPVTEWLCGEDQVEPDVATSCVCGPMADGRWMAVDLTQFEPSEVH